MSRNTSNINFNSQRNITNTRFKNLLSGEAVEIGDDRKINVSMKHDTEEQTTIGDTDLFLIADSTGKIVKYITGINLKQKALLHLVGGTNINLTTDAQGDTEINLDNSIDTAGSITCENFMKIKKSSASSTNLGGILSLEGSLGQLSYPFRYKSQVFHTNVGDAYQIIAEDNSSNERLLFQLHSGTNASTRHTADFNTANISSVNSADITALTGTTTINGYNSNVFTLNNKDQQYLIKDTNKNVVANDILSVDSNFKLSPITPTALLNTLTVSNGLTKSTNDISISTSPTINISDTMTLLGSGSAILKIQAGSGGGDQPKLQYFHNNTLKATQQYDNANNKLDFTSVTSLHLKGYSGTQGGTGRITLDSEIVKLQAGDANNQAQDILTCSLTQVDIYKELVLSNAANAIFKIQAGSTGADQPIIQFIQNNSIRAVQNYDEANNKFDFTSVSALHLKAYSGTQSGTARISLDSEIVKLQAGDSSNQAQDILTCSLTTVDIYKELDMNDNQITFKTNDDFQYIKFLNDSTLNGLEIVGYGEGSSKASHRFKAGQNTSNILELYPDKVDVSKILNVSTDGIDQPGNNLNIKANGTVLFTGSSDRMHFNKRICFTSSDNNDRFIVLQGSDINSDSRIIGYNNRIDFIGKETSSSNPAMRFISGSTTVFQIHLDRINMFKPVNMNNNILNFKTNNDSAPNYANYIKYTSSLMDGLELKGVGSTTLPLFKVKSSSNVDLINVYTDRVDTLKKLSIIKDSSTLQNDANDIFTVRNTGFTKMIVHSTNADCEIALRTQSHQSVINYYTDQQFRITTGGEFRTVATSHNFFNSSTLRLAFQSDTNLVVYNGSTVKFASNDSQNAHSSREYKKNINDLVESDSIDIIKNINPVSYEYLEQYWDENDRCNACNCDLRKGFIWEDTKPILPQCCRTINMNNPDEPTTKTLDLKMVIPDLTKTVQYLLNKVETQSALISDLQEQINNLVNNK